MVLPPYHGFAILLHSRISASLPEQLPRLDFDPAVSAMRDSTANGFVPRTQARGLHPWPVAIPDDGTPTPPPRNNVSTSNAAAAHPVPTAILEEDLAGFGVQFDRIHYLVDSELTILNS